MTGETIIGANFIKDLKASITDFFGGRSTSYEKVLIKAKNTALKELEERAIQMGANAIIGVDIDYEALSAGGNMLMVSLSGTAVII